MAPDQLALMGIDKSVADADSIYKVDLTTKTVTLLSSGHNIMVRRK